MHILIVSFFYRRALYNFANVNNSNVCIAVAIKISLNCLNISRVQLFEFVCRWVCFSQSLTEINIAVQQLDEVDREVKLWSHIGGGHYVSEPFAWTFANGSNREIKKTRNRRERGSL